MRTPRFHRHKCLFVLSVVAILFVMTLPVRVLARAGGRNNKQENTISTTPGTLVRLVQRDVLIHEDSSTDRRQVQRLRFELPSTFVIPKCCDGHTRGLLHVHVALPPLPGEKKYKQNPYSMHLVPPIPGKEARFFDLIVKIYPSETGTSDYLSKVPIHGYVHLPDIRATDFKETSQRTAMTCFGVGITGCLDPAHELLERGGEVKMLFANRDVESVIPIPELESLVTDFPSTFSLTHYLSRSTEVVLSQAENVFTKHGRIDEEALKEEFGDFDNSGGVWSDGGNVENYLIMGTTKMEDAIIRSLVDIKTLRGHPEFLLLKGPYGTSSGWQPLSPKGSVPDEEGWGKSPRQHSRHHGYVILILLSIVLLLGLLAGYGSVEGRLRISNALFRMAIPEGKNK